jgi:general secretion pathway protein D
MVGDARSGALAAFGPSNHLVITDTADNIRRMETILAQLDRPGSARVVEVIQLHHASADEVASQIMQAMRGAEKAGTKLSRHVKRIAQGDTSLPTDVVVVPASHANSLVIVGSPVEITELKQIVSELDRESEAGRGPLNPIFLKYLSAEQASKSLNALLDKSADKDNRRVAIEPSIANNALLVSASPRDFEWVRGLVAQLDQVPQQVLVEILIAEVTVGKNLDLGVEWSTIEQPEDGTTTFIGRSRPDDQDYVTDYLAQGVFPQGFMIGVARGTYVDANGNIVPKIPFLLKAMSQDSDINILSSIPLWAQNNTEASVSVVDNIPLLKSTIEGGAGTARDVIQNIDRMDVGIKLTLTPHVNPDGEVLMELNPSIEAITDEGPADQPFTPTISKREVTTTVTVPDKATIAITGLIREDMVQTVNKVPLLGDIPLLGHLFRNTSRQKKRTNLLIFVTPHIVTDMREALEMKKAWEEATQLGQVATNVTVRTSIGE